MSAIVIAGWQSPAAVRTLASCFGAENREQSESSRFRQSGPISPHKICPSGCWSRCSRQNQHLAWQRATLIVASRQDSRSPNTRANLASHVRARGLMRAASTRQLRPDNFPSSQAAGPHRFRWRPPVLLTADCVSCWEHESGVGARQPLRPLPLSARLP